MKMPMQSHAALCIASPARTHTAIKRRSLTYRQRSLPHCCVYTHTHNNEACLRLCACKCHHRFPLYLPPFNFCFLFIFVGFSCILYVCACAVSSTAAAAAAVYWRRRRVHKCKFTRTFEMCSHSGTKTIVINIARH